MKKKSKHSAADQAMMGSDKHTLADLAIEPWTQDREWAAALMGMAYPNLGKEGREQLRRTNVYRDAVKDVCIWLWLSTLTADQVEDAARYPDESFVKARSFGMKRGVHRRDSDEFWDAYNMFWKIMEEARSTATKPKTLPGAGTDDDDDDDDPKA